MAGSIEAANAPTQLTRGLMVAKVATPRALTLGSSLLCLSLLSSCPVRADLGELFTSFDRALPASPTPTDFCVADLTSDGALDLAVLNAQGIKILVGDGRGEFTPLLTLPTEPGAVGITAADIDDDGYVDLGVANHASNSLSIYMGRSGGAFDDGTLVDAGILPNGLAFDHFDDDGVLDVAVVNYDYPGGMGTVSILLGLGDGRFGPRQAFPTVSKPFSMVVVDVNLDGKPDVVTPGVGVATAEYAVLLGNGDGTLSAPRISHCGNEPLKMGVGRLNADAWPDLVFISKGNHTISTLFGHGNGHFTCGQSLPAPEYPFSVDLADLDRDGDEDVAVLGYYGQAIQLYLNQGNGSLTPTQAIRTAPAPIAVRFARVTPDDDPDLLFTSASTWTISVLAGNGNGGLGGGLEFATGEDPRAVIAEDFNGDGFVDLATANWPYGSSSLLLGSGDGRFSDRVDYPTHPGSRELATADLDGDGRLDLVVLNHTPNYAASYSVLMGRVEGGFRTLPGVALNSGFERVQIVRIDSDPHPDLLLIGSASAYTSRGRGDGTFDPPQLQENIGPSIIAADVDQDGLDDLVVSRYPECEWQDDHSGQCYQWGPHRLFVRRSLGDGSFGPPVDTPVSATYTLAFADLDADGQGDLVAGSYSGTTMMKGIGALVFGPATVSPGLGWPRDFAFADFDRDGFLDAVATYTTLHQSTLTARPHLVGLLRGDGTGRLELARGLYGFGGEISRVAVGDLNDDSWPDIAVATSRNSVALLMNRGDAPVTVLTALVDVSTSADTVRLAWRLSPAVEAREVQRSVGGKWVPVGAMLETGDVCRFEERRVSPGQHSYRLAYSDKAGGVSAFSEPVMVEVLRQGFGIEMITPNPVGFGVTTARVRASQNGEAMIRVYDIQGRQRSRSTLSLSPGRTDIPISCRGLGTGLYVLQLTLGSQSTTRSFAVVR